MTVSETVLIYVGVPLAVAGLLALAVFGAGSGARRAPRYRPGRPFDFSPVWFVSATHPGAPSVDDGAATRQSRPELEARQAERRGVASAQPATKKGGARGTW